MFEYAGNVHLHTLYSDGTKWHADVAIDAIKAGLDFLIFTDHNIWVDKVEGYYTSNGQKLLVLVGEEVHDVRREPQANHFLAYGADKELATYGPDPQRLVDATRQAGGFGFLAHPFDVAAPVVGESDLGWKDWEIEGYTGLEIWNYMSNFKSHLTSMSKILLAAFSPSRTIIGPLPETLAKWDELLKDGRKVLAVGSSDAHGMRYSLGPLSKIIFPYEFLFKAVNMHVLTERELGQGLESDKRNVLSAIGLGRSWIGYDLPAKTKGFRFYAEGENTGQMGDSVQLDAAIKLTAETPANCTIRLICDGEPLAEVKNTRKLSVVPSRAGAYRIECLIQYKGKDRGWIYSNPIFLKSG